MSYICGQAGLAADRSEFVWGSGSPSKRKGIKKGVNLGLCGILGGLALAICRGWVPGVVWRPCVVPGGGMEALQLATAHSTARNHGVNGAIVHHLLLCLLLGGFCCGQLGSGSEGFSARGVWEGPDPSPCWGPQAAPCVAVAYWLLCAWLGREAGGSVCQQ